MSNNDGENPYYLLANLFCEQANDYFLDNYYEKTVIYCDKDVNEYNISRAYIIKGMAYRNKDNLEEALAFYDKDIDIEETNEMIYYHKAIIYEIIGNYKFCIINLLNIMQKIKMIAMLLSSLKKY